MKKHLNRIFNKKNMIITICWFIGFGVSLPIIKLIEPQTSINEILTTFLIVLEISGLLIYLIIINYFKEISMCVVKSYYVVRNCCINIYKKYVNWLNN